MQLLHLPRTDSELAHWRPYADQLLEQGDKLGEVIAYDLAMPHAPNEAELDAFQRLARRVCHASRYLKVGWGLGHARAVRVIGSEANQLGGAPHAADRPVRRHRPDPRPAPARCPSARAGW